MYIWPQIEAAREKCQQERFWFPRPVVPGLFGQLSCGCIWQDEECPESDKLVYAGSLYCEHCEGIRLCLYVGTMYSTYAPLCTGPLTEMCDYHLRKQLSIKCPISPCF